MLTYIIYEQRPPIPNGRKVNRAGEYDRRGEYEDCSANLVALGHVVADSNADAWRKAKLMTRKPVLEEIKAIDEYAIFDHIGRMARKQ